MLIRTKRKYFELAKLNLVGNTVKTWDTANDFLKDSKNKTVAIRSTKAGSNFSMYVSREKLKGKLIELGLGPKSFYLTTPIPPEDYILAGELSWVNGSWVLWHTFVQAPMREALQRGGNLVYGYKAVWSILEAHCTPKDIEDLKNLFDRYTHLNNHPTIEFTVTRKDWGIIPHRNVLHWEIRHY